MTTPTPLRCLLRAGLLTALVDGLWACVLSLAYQSTPARLFQGVASTLLGPEALSGGNRTALIGVFMHIGVAFGWSTVFLGVYKLSPAVRTVLSRRFGAARIAAVYGPFVWMTMSLVVIPLLVRRPPAITVRWWIQLAGHIPFVGMPIVTPFVPLARGAGTSSVFAASGRSR